MESDNLRKIQREFFFKWSNAMFLDQNIPKKLRNDKRVQVWPPIFLGFGEEGAKPSYLL